jgi:hypothetical protein
MFGPKKDEVIRVWRKFHNEEIVPCLSIHPWLYSPCGPWPLFQFLNLHTDGRTLWSGDQLVTRPLPSHRRTKTQNKHTQTFMS